MKRFGFLVTAFLVSSILFSCVKYENKLKGKVIYIAYYDDKEYPAVGALMQKVAITKGKEEIVSAVLADSNGYFLFDYVTEGDWKIKAKFTDEDAIYEGESTIIHVSGEDIKEVRLVLEFTEMITNE